MRAAALALLLAVAVAPAHAQAPVAAESAGALAVPAPSRSPAQVDASKLGISMSRIQRGLRMSEDGACCRSVLTFRHEPPTAAAAATEIVDARRVQQIGKIHDGSGALATGTLRACRGHFDFSRCEGESPSYVNSCSVFVAFILRDEIRTNFEALQEAPPCTTT